MWNFLSTSSVDKMFHFCPTQVQCLPHILLCWQSPLLKRWGHCWKKCAKNLVARRYFTKNTQHFFFLVVVVDLFVFWPWTIKTSKQIFSLLILMPTFFTWNWMNNSFCLCFSVKLEAFDWSELRLWVIILCLTNPRFMFLRWLIHQYEHTL